jgi:hypothetical protein
VRCDTSETVGGERTEIVQARPDRIALFAILDDHLASAYDRVVAAVRARRERAQSEH